MKSCFLEALATIAAKRGSLRAAVAVSRGTEAQCEAVAQNSEAATYYPDANASFRYGAKSPYSVTSAVFECLVRVWCCEQ